MKLTSKDKIINESIAEKLSLARDLSRQEKFLEAIQAYHKVLFLREEASFMAELAEIYERIGDPASAALFYRRAHQLSPNPTAIQKVRLLSKAQGLQLLELGSVRNIMTDSEFECFAKRYPSFHRRLFKKTEEKEPISDYLLSCLGYLEVNQRQLALAEADNCIMLQENDADLLVLRALILWSLLEIPRGYEQFWAAFRVDRTNPQVVLFLQMIAPQLDRLYRQAKYDLIEHKTEKCRLKVRKGLQMHPYHTQLLILSAYLHRSRQEYEQALADLQLANKHLQDKNMEEQLRSQISLTYNQMGIFLYRQGKFAQALTLFTEGLAFKPGDWGMLTNRGDCHRAASNFIKALEDYLLAYQSQKKNEELNFRIASIYSLRGVALFNSKNYDLALKQFDESAKYSPKCAQFALSKAKCLLQLGNKQQATQELERCVALQPNNSQGSLLLQQLKDPEERIRAKNGRKVIFLSKEK